MIDRIAIQRTAQALYSRHGPFALDIANERVGRLMRDGDFPVLDSALLILTAVERLVGSERSVGDHALRPDNVVIHERFSG